MDEVPSADELALQELEHLLYEKRRPISERKARSVVASELALSERLVPRQVVPLTSLPVYPPATWRGAAQQDRYFRSLTLYPLHARVRWELPAPGDRRAGALVNLLTAERSQGARWGHRVLTAFEVLAALALVVVVGLLYRRLHNLYPTVLAPLPTQEVPATTGAPVTPEAVALLPGGHPAPADAAQQRTKETHAQVAMAAPPTPGPQTARRLTIPRLQVDAPIVEGDTLDDLKMGVGQRIGSARPGEPSNMVVSAHNDIYGEIFRDLDKLEPGDEVLVYTDAGAYRYVVHTVEIVLPTRVDVLDPTDHAVLTMITCYPYLLDTHRVVVVADLVE